MNAICSRTFGRSGRNSAGASNFRASRLHAPGSTIAVVPAGTCTSPTAAVYSGSRSSGFSTSSMLTSLNVITRTCLTNRAGRYMSHTQASANRNSK
jgi:hypothetical protein